MKVMKFSAPWCSACKVLSRTMESVDFGAIELVEVNTDERPELAKMHGIRGLPTMILFDDVGAEVNRLVGSQPKATVEQFLQS